MLKVTWLLLANHTASFQLEVVYDRLLAIKLYTLMSGQRPDIVIKVYEY